MTKQAGRTAQRNFPVVASLAAGLVGGCSPAIAPDRTGAAVANRRSVVHEIGAQRVDVPQDLLARDGSGMLRNGLVPLPQQFD